MNTIADCRPEAPRCNTLCRWWCYCCIGLYVCWVAVWCNEVPYRMYADLYVVVTRNVQCSWW